MAVQRHDLRFFTIGHSTRLAADFLVLLRAHGVEAVADVRTVPRSRRHPHFASHSTSSSLSVERRSGQAEALETWLAREGIVYQHFRGLGGLRKPAADSSNGGWRHPGFRGYADHMQTRAFADALHDLLEFGRTRQVAIMCAEAKWWQCHRQLIADALVARGIEVLHIMTAREAALHVLTPFARVEGERVRYPALV
jgi:uncharacterized protein (DUF488 family)